jgi:CRP-like cAMP-binding protein
MSKIDATALRAIPFFARLSDQDLEQVLPRARAMTFEPGDAILERGKAGTSMYVVRSGSAQVDVGGRYHVLKQGDLIGEMGVLSGKPRMATVRAGDALEAIEVDGTDMDGLLRDAPGLAVQILRIVVERLREAEERIDAWMGTYVS